MKSRFSLFVCLLIDDSLLVMRLFRFLEGKAGRFSGFRLTLLVVSFIFMFLIALGKRYAKIYLEG